MKKIALALLLLSTVIDSKGQYMRGFINSNYSGMQGVFFNPANLADSRAKLEINLISAYTDVNNNHVDIHTPYSQWKALRDKLPAKYLDQNGYPIYKNEYGIEKLNGQKKHFYGSTEIVGPSFMFNLDDKSGFAFANRTRLFTHLGGLNEDLLKIFLEDLDTTGPGYVPLQNQHRYIGERNTQNAFGLGVSAFEEFDFSYARVFYNKKENFIKGGITFKYLIGLGAAFVTVDELDYELVAEDSIHLYSAEMEVAYVNEKYFENRDLRLNDILGKNKLGKGFGIDLGIVYEYRPHYKTYKYKMDKKTHEDRSQNKYLWKVGASINDFGSITYNNAPHLTNINVSSNELVKWSNFNSIKSLGGSTDADSFIYDLYAGSDSVNRFKIAMPTSLNINFDWKYNKNIYFSGSYVQSLRARNVEGVKKQNVVALTARYEEKLYEASLSVLGGNFYHKVHLGAFVRFGPVFIGTDHLGGVFTPKRTEGVNLYAGIKVPIHYHRIKDSDNDLVSDKKDKCPDEPGSTSAAGCPDEDGDKVADKDDLCPSVPGKRNTKGCPDEDGDKLVGDEDKCPDKAGTKDDMGCPDTDGDGLADHLDRCPDEKGSKELHGCPYEEKDTVVKRDTVVEPKVEPKPKPKAKDTIVDTGITTEYDHIINQMDFDQYNYYIILGAYTNKDYADYLVSNLKSKANVETFIFREVDGSTYYVTVGKAQDKRTAQEQVLMLSRPDVRALINGHVWWKKIPR